MSLIKCGDCGRQVSDAASSCPHCGRPQVVLTPNERHARATATKRSDLRTLKIVGVSAVVIAIIVTCSNVVDDMQNQAAARNQEERAAKTRAADQQWVMEKSANEAALSLSDAMRYDSLVHALHIPVADRVSHDRVARHHAFVVDSALAAASAIMNQGTRPNLIAAERLMRLVGDPLSADQQDRKNTLIRLIDRRKSALDAEAKTLARQLFAKTYENGLLDQGLNVDVTVSGDANTTLRLKWVLVSKVVVHQFEQNTEFFEQMRKIGFRRFVLTDGYDETWAWDLTK